MQTSIHKPLSLQCATALLWFLCGHAAMAQQDGAGMAVGSSGGATSAKKADIRTLCPQRPNPEFPRAAVNANITGTVVAEARIADGKVQSVRFISGPEVYYAPVRNAMLQYRCEPSVGEVFANQEFVFKMDTDNQMRRLAGPTMTNARQSAGPTASYAARVQAAVKEHITFSEELPGNPVSEIEVRLATDGEILDIRLVTSSGFAAWDNATVTALKKTERMPLDVDGRVPPRMILAFRPK